MDIQSLVSAADYSSERQTAFPSETAVVWYMRRWRDELNAAGALVIVNRRLLIEPHRFDAVVLQVGSRLAEKQREAA